MRRILLFFVLLLGFATALQAQGEPIRINGAFSFTSAVTTGPSISLIGSSVQYHEIAWYATGTVSACTVQLQQSADNATWTTLIASQACTTTGAMTSATAATPNYVRIDPITKTGSGSVTVSYRGYISNPHAGGSVTVTGPVGTTPASSGYTTDFYPGVAVVSSGSTSTITATMTLLQNFTCNNRSPSSITMQIMDSSGNYIAGPSFTMPGNSQMDKSWPAGMVWSGITASASAASALYCNWGGKQ